MTARKRYVWRWKKRIDAVELLSAVVREKPETIYALSKLLKRNADSVLKRARQLESRGLLKLEETYRNGRRCIRPVVDVRQCDR